MMTEENEIEIAMTILNKAAIIENRALIVFELEEELATIYSELDDATTPSSSDTPIQYYSEVQTEFDLISNGEIHRSLYKVITKEQRSFLRKITHHEDFYLNVNRGEGYNFVQEWYFNIKLKKEDFLLDYDEHISFSLRVGVRDLFPYEIEIDYFTNQIEYSTLLNHFKNL
jgi:hypothetical protein